MTNIKKIHLFIDDEKAMKYIQELNTTKIVLIEYGKKNPYIQNYLHMP